MAIGGYQILDLKGTNFTSNDHTNGHKIAGIYEKVKGTKKAFLLENYSVDGIEKEAEFMHFVVNGSSYVGYIGANGGQLISELLITIKSNDTVIIEIS